MQRGECGDRDVHAGKAIGGRVEFLHESKETFRATTAEILRAPFGGRGDRKKDEEYHLEQEQHQEAACHVKKMPGRGGAPVDGDDYRIIEETVDPHPPGLIGDEVVERRTEFARARDVMALAPEVELVHADDEEHAKHELND